MSSADVIDALFVKTVDMVQSLPKSGPIQTSYEEKLALYSLYKQATEGDVQSKRPGMLDMLGRAKWDAWSKVSGMPPRDAKQMYVESMLRILRRFSDRPQAAVLIEELENFSGQVAQHLMDGSLAQVDSDEQSISDTLSDDQQRLDPTSLHQPPSGPSRAAQPHLPRHLAPTAPSITATSTAATRGVGHPSAVSPGRTPMASESEEEETSEDHRLGSQPGPLRGASRLPARHRPPSVESYRPQPRAGSNYPRQGEPGNYQRSRYAASSVGGGSVGRRSGPPRIYPPRPPSNAGTARPQPRPEMEMALESIQASLAALHERLNRVEGRFLDDPGRAGSGQSSSARLYTAIMNVVEDIKHLIGLNLVARGARSEALAPSFLAQGGAWDKGSKTAYHFFTWPVRILVALVKLSARLALDLISLVLVSSFLLFALKRITGRGDALLMIRMLKRLQQAIVRRSPRAKQLLEQATA
ncbi:hypothetical protein NDA18_001548 [Ustilago nuda]|nr:hypothetical protein NDA18_001548 [Ustilago nuda]